MITSDGTYWVSAITATYDSHRDHWGARLGFYDDGFADDDPATGRISTEGTLGTRYYVANTNGAGSGLAVALDVLIADAERLGIKFGGVGGMPPCLFYDDQDGTFPPPDDWDAIGAGQAKRLGLRSDRATSTNEGADR
ncbi:MAG TPA: hypothetical protein VK453_25680 [Micromonosporaceae bacterium]|nr:hypothetical protein [Micromonosporaceae bacterium]